MWSTRCPFLSTAEEEAFAFIGANLASSADPSKHPSRPCVLLGNALYGAATVLLSKALDNCIRKRSTRTDYATERSLLGAYVSMAKETMSIDTRAASVVSMIYQQHEKERLARKRIRATSTSSKRVARHRGAHSSARCLGRSVCVEGSEETQ